MALKLNTCTTCMNFFEKKNLSNESRRAFFQIGHFPITVCTSVAFLFFPPCYNKHFFIFHEYFSRSSNFSQPFTVLIGATFFTYFYLTLFYTGFFLYVKIRGGVFLPPPPLIKARKMTQTW